MNNYQNNSLWSNLLYKWHLFCDGDDIPYIRTSEDGNSFYVKTHTEKQLLNLNRGMQYVVECDMPMPDGTPSKIIFTVKGGP